VSGSGSGSASGSTSGSGGATAGEVVAVRDLDVVRDGAWPRLLAEVTADPVLRRAVVEDVAVVDSRRARRRVPSYSAWWLRAELGLEGTVAAGDGPGASEGLLDGLLDPAPAWVRDLDPAVRRALGVLDDVSVGPLGPAVVATLLERTAEPERAVGVRSCLTLWRELAALAPDGIDPPERLRVLAGERTVVVDAEGAFVPDDPRWLQRGDLGGLVVPPAGAAAHLADLLDLPLASELAAGRVDSVGTRVPVAAVVRDLLPDAPGSWLEHEQLLVDGQPVDWWVDDDGVPHAATSDGLARALAWSTGAWTRRHLVAAVLADPADAVRLAVEAATD